MFQLSVWLHNYKLNVNWIIKENSLTWQGFRFVSEIRTHDITAKMLKLFAIIGSTLLYMPTSMKTDLTYQNRKKLRQYVKLNSLHDLTVDVWAIFNKNFCSLNQVRIGFKCLNCHCRRLNCRNCNDVLKKCQQSVAYYLNGQLKT